MRTTVVNKKYTDEWDIDISRNSILGNPYTHLPIERTKAKFQVRTRKEAIERYLPYALERMKTDPEFAAALEACRGRRLGCVCKPLDCHGDIIVEILEGKEQPCLF